MARAKGDGLGSIYYRKDRNVWLVQSIYYDSTTNKQKKRTKSFSTKEEAEDYLKRLALQKEDKSYIENKGIILIDIMRARVQRKLDTNLISENQFYRTEATLKMIEKSYLAKMKIDEITTDQLQEYFNDLAKKYSNSSIKKFHEQFKQAYEYAMQRGYIVKNPLTDFIKPKSKKQDKIVRALTVEEQQTFTNYLLNQTLESYRYKNAFLIQMYMGLRIGEVMALKKGDIDLAHNLMCVQRTITTGKNAKPVMGNTTKTYSGVRELPIPKFLLPYIVEQLEECKKHKDNLLFESKEGTLADGRNINSILKKTLKYLGIEGISTHSLRHTFGTRSVESGMRAVALQRLMGHKDVSVTLNTYTSVFNKYKESEIEKLNDYYIENNFLNDDLIQLLDKNNNDNKEIERE